MSWWDSFTSPINKALNSNVFKVAFPVQALAQGATQVATGLNPANQYAAGAAGGSALAGGAALFGGGGGASAMSPYMPTSTPVMGNAGSTLGGGMGSSMNLAPSAMGSTGAAGGMGGGAAASPSAVSQALNYMRMMPQGGGQQAPATSQENILQKLYQMFPELRPGANFGQRPNIGGM